MSRNPAANANLGVYRDFVNGQVRAREGMNGETRTRTGDTTIFSRVLYQLSYLAASDRCYRLLAGRRSLVIRIAAETVAHSA